MERVDVINVNEDEVYNTLVEKIKARFLEFKSKDMLICNRFRNPSFLNIFKDSLYTYNDGSILVERFFIKDKCVKYPFSYKKFKKEDIELMKEFENFSNNIPDIMSLTDDEARDYTDKINNYQDKINSMIPEIETMELFKHNNTVLMELQSIDDEVIEKLSHDAARLFIQLTNALTWEDLSDKGIITMGVPNENYIDMIITYVSNNEGNSEN